jgi:N-acetylmuramoyl-L-alanine amidase
MLWKIKPWFLRTKCNALLFSVVAAFICFTTSWSFALGDSPSYDRAADELNQLRRHDPRVSKPKEWERVGSDLAAFTETDPGSANVPNALFALGQLYEQLYTRHRSSPTFEKAISYYDRLVFAYEGHQLADDALLRIGELQSGPERDPVRARAAYFEIHDRYSETNSYEAAKAGLARLEQSESATQPSSSAQSATAPSVGSSDRNPTESVEPVRQAQDQPARQVYVRDPVLERPVVVIDAGHGGEEEGAIGVNGLLEKEVVLQIAKYLAELLEDRLRAKTFLTRTADVTLSLAERTKLANDKHADLFISISLAHHIQTGLVKTLSRYYRNVKDLGVKKAPFYVLVGAHMPCVLVEVSFIDHPMEGKRLADPRYQRLVAQSLYLGSRDFFESRKRK